MRRFGKVLSFVLAVVFVIGLVPVMGTARAVSSIDSPASGSIAISDRAGLEAIRDNLSGAYHLTADINLSGTDWIPIGYANTPFTGTFDGQGHVISNMKIAGTQQSSGFFGYAYGATIKNVGLEKTDINVNYSGIIYTGGICGLGDGGGTEKTEISNCYCTGAIYASAPNRSFVGGICGACSNGSYINQCYNTTRVSATSSSSSAFFPASFAGGICGELGVASISNCYNMGEISSISSSSDSYAGGICGRLNIGSISDCYNVERITSTSSATNSYGGGILGSILSGTTSNCYWNSDAIQVVNGTTTTNKKGVGNGTDSTTLLTTAQMKQQSSFGGFDFDTVWGINSTINNGYPYLLSFTGLGTDTLGTYVYNGHSYKIYDIGMTWDEAKSYCENLGGHLVTITTQDEQDFLSNLIINSSKKNLWLGAELINGEFKWITQEPFVYTNWNGGEPNNVFNSQNTIMMYTYSGTNNNGYRISPGKWNDESKNGRNWPGYTIAETGFVCEWDGSNTGTQNTRLVGLMAYTCTLGETVTMSCDFTSDSLDATASTVTWTCSDPSAVSFGDATFIYPDQPNQKLATIFMPITSIKPGIYAITVTASDGAYATENLTIKDGIQTGNDPHIDLSIDSDGDGLPDEWEIHGIDTNGDGIVDLPLNLMGADPNHKDIFVEVDWMVKPEKKISEYRVEQGGSLAPSAETLKEVEQVFDEHGINLHIDAGPDSVMNFRTGQKWENLSEGNEIPYLYNIYLNTDVPFIGLNANWKSLIAHYFNELVRGKVFRYAMFINQFNNDTTPGLAQTPGQFFVVASGQTFPSVVANVFMHELGHTLGLGHGGTKANGEVDNTNYKPNYLSIMNYLFQNSGLIGVSKDVSLDYSEYKLPDLNELTLSEQAGIDPNGLTTGTGIGTKILVGLTNKDIKTAKSIIPIAKVGIDYNGDGSISNQPMISDLNNDLLLGTLTSSNDWENLKFKEGGIGNWNFADTSGDVAAVETEAPLQDFIDKGLLGNPGTGWTEVVGPFTIVPEHSGQNIWIRVNNFTAEDTTFELNVEANGIVPEYSITVTVPKCTNGISYVDVPVPVVNNPQPGNYELTTRLKNPLQNDFVNATTINVPVVGTDNTEFVNAIINGELDNVLPQEVIDQYVNMFNIEEYTTPNDKNNNNTRPGGGDSNFIVGNNNPGAGVATQEASFISGYPDGTFRPDNSITRAEVATIIANLLNTDGTVDLTVLDRFSDNLSGYWAKNALAFAVANGYMKGYPDGTLKPDGNITRAELTQLAYNLDIAKSSGTPKTFSDVSGHWAIDAINAMSSSGVINGYPDGTFRPNNPITRAETVAMIARLFDRSQEWTGAKTFSDVRSTHWAYKYIMNAANGK